MKLSPNFTLEELTFTSVRQFDNTPNDLQINNLRRLSELLEEVRALIDKPIIIDSGFRCVDVNQAVGGKINSQHLSGCAADIRVAGMTPQEVVEVIHESTLDYDQLILELGWTHISIPNNPVLQPRKMALIIDKSGTRAYA
jgi:hypothetical protein